MKLFWKILISFALIGGLSGGLFWYAKTNRTETVFESQSANRDIQESIPPVEVPPTVQKDDVSAGTAKEDTSLESKKETVETKEKVVEKKETSKDEAPKSFKVESSLVSFGHESASGRKVDTIVLHSSYNPNGDPYSVGAVRSIWQSYGVAPHYMIARDGAVYQLVSDKDIAYHAGESTMKDGRKNVNDFSIGVEILNTKDDEYTRAQYQAIKDLIAYLKGKYSIKYVVGHDDIAPGRKTDPWNFDWNKL